MVKLIVLALAFAALVAFASAHRTIVVTTTEEDIDQPRRSQQQCSRQLQGQRFNQCQRYLQQDQSLFDDNRKQKQSSLNLCCQELENVDEQCQCAAVKQVFRQAQQQQEQQERQQGERFGSQQMQQLREKAQNLPNKCRLETRQCQIPTIMAITNTDRSAQQCRQQVQRQRFNQCQRYLAQQMGSSETLLMSIYKKREPQSGIQLCCEELQKVDEQCQCEAMQEVFEQAQQQLGSQQRGEQQRIMMGEKMLEIAEKLINQCNIEVEQCRTPSEMF